MERFKKLATEFKGFVFGFVLSLFFVGGAVYAWNAVWHGTDWIGSGETIRAREIAENLEWLKLRVDKIDSIPTCTGKNKALQYNGSSFVCTTLNAVSSAQTGSQNCDAQKVLGNYSYTQTTACGNIIGTSMRTTYYNCPRANNNATVTCISEYRSLRSQFQCTNGIFVQKTIPSVTSGYNSGLCSCFTKETLVSMADGTKKKISDIKIGDRVLGKDGIVNIVKDIEKVPLAGRKLYSINGSVAFVTAEHPFLTKDGWKSIDPDALLQEEPSLAQKLDPKTLQIGDVLITEKGEITITSIEPKDAPEQTVYNLILDGNNTYYANGFLVHNKD